MNLRFDSLSTGPTLVTSSEVRPLESLAYRSFLVASDSIFNFYCHPLFLELLPYIKRLERNNHHHERPNSLSVNVSPRHNNEETHIENKHVVHEHWLKIHSLSITLNPAQ
jgi:hypothetical protein